ncbi:MAG TPA: hypothetical protein VGK67_05390 [Myxococcales bacterium]|jgi:hypothetical protein
MRRELNEIEYLNWCVGQPYNMVVAVQIRGDLHPDRLREALAKAQRRHPLLAVNTELGPSGLPWFDSEGVGAIPLTVVDQAEPDQAKRLLETEPTSRFAMNEPGSPRLPLLRASLFLPRDPAHPADLVFTVQHVIADGLSMVFLVRDLLHFMEEPDAPVTVLDAPASPADLMPPRVRRWIPKSRLLFTLALGLAKAYAWLFYGRRPAPSQQGAHHQRSWELTPDQTTRLRSRCKAEGVSVQSAICTTFLTGFSSIHTPVSLRSALARPVGESVGLYIGAAEVAMKYRPASSFWDNARRFHRKLRRAMRNPFGVYRLFSKAVPAALVPQLGNLLVRIASDQHPFAVTNLGQLDASGLQLQGKNLKIESFVGAVTGIVDSSVLTVYTIGGSMRLHLLASEAGPTETAVRDDAERAVRRLLEALGA